MVMLVSQRDLASKAPSPTALTCPEFRNCCGFYLVHPIMVLRQSFPNPSRASIESRLIKLWSFKRWPENQITIG